MPLLEVSDRANVAFPFRYDRYKFSRQIVQQIKPLTQLDNWHGLLALLEDYSIIIVSIFCTCRLSWWFYPIALLTIGSRQRALATILHESAHQTLAKNKWLNLILGTFCSGYLIFQQSAAYKESHCLNHHCHLGNPDRDPDLKFYLSSGLYKPLNKQEFIIEHIWKPLLLLRLPNYIFYLVRYRLLPANNRGREYLILLSYWSLIIAVAVWLGVWDKLIIFWFIPYLTTFQILGWFIELSEHYPLLGNSTIDIYLSRNRFSPWYEAFFTSMHRENFHLNHHLFPSIPFWNMDKLHKILLIDATYRACNGVTGGIFFNRKNCRSILDDILNLVEKKNCGIHQQSKHHN
jgi:fatty acid desaturase